MKQTNLFTNREKQVVALLLQGKSNKQIALALGISARTVEFHLTNVFVKLQVKSRTEAILKLGQSTGSPTGAEPVEPTVEAAAENRHTSIELESQTSGAARHSVAVASARREAAMKNRWKSYVIAGLAFGVVEWVLMEVLSVPSKSPILSGVLNEVPTVLQIGLGLILALIMYGAWFIVAIPVIAREMRLSQSVATSALAVVIVWSTAMIGYYGFYSFLLLFIGLPHMDFMVVTRVQPTADWFIWWQTFRSVILNQLIEKVFIMLIAGTVVGPVMALVVRHYFTKRFRPSAGALGS